MVSTAAPIRSQDGATHEVLEVLAAGLDTGERARLAGAVSFAESLYAGRTLSTGEPVLPHALGVAESLASIGMDVNARAAGVLFAAPKFLDGDEALHERFGPEIASLAAGAERLYQVRVSTRPGQRESLAEGGDSAQSEVLRKMVLAMVDDVRVVLIRLASRTQTLRWMAKRGTPDDVPGMDRAAYARETLQIYAPLANRLGVWQLKWELEDRSFRFLEPEAYVRIARMLDEKRTEREHYIAQAIRVLGEELAGAGVTAEIYGRPKHIYSIWNKMKTKGLDFSAIYDVRALRVIVADVKACYAALGVVHNLWQSVAEEFDDYVARPKGNNYQSLHTAVIGPQGRTLEVQIRTDQMHRDAELGIAAHWRYKEGRAKADAQGFDDKIAWLRELLAWRDEVAAGVGWARSTGWAEGTRRAALDDTVYALSPLGKVVDIPAGGTPIDFAYMLHTDLGHRCRGAKLDGQIVPLDTPIRNGQRVEILAAKSGGPSRDWLNVERGFVRSARARQKIRQWFNNAALADTIAAGRATLERELRREGGAHANLDALAAKLGFARQDELFAAIGRDEVNLRPLQTALRELKGPAPRAPGAGHATERSVPSHQASPRKAAKGDTAGSVLVVGMDQVLTQLARCCKPVPPDPIRGFVTRGRGASIHREDCASFKRLAAATPERVLDVRWGSAAAGRGYSVEIAVVAQDRPGLLRDIGDALARERINVTAVRTQSRDDVAFMHFMFEVSDLAQLKRAFGVVKEVPGVIRAARG